jgi:hypothetical protein
VDNRVVAVLIAATVVALGGCAATPPALGARSAEVTVNGSGQKLPVECSQAGWTWLISTFDEAKPGFSAAISTGEGVAAHSVQLRDLDGFSGAYWERTVGDGRATVNGNTITITGTAEGNFADNPSDAASAKYEIQTTC